MALNYQAAVNITATYDGKGVNQAQNAFQKFDGTIKGTLRGLGSLKSAFGALGAALAVREIGMMAKNVIDLGDNLNDLRQKTGIGVQALSDLKTAAEKNGLSFDQFESSLKKFSVTLIKAQNGSKEAAAGFKALGLDPKEFKNADDALFALADKFKNAEDGAAKAAVAVALFGKTGADLIPLLNQGTEGIKGMGVQMSEEFTREADRFNDNLVDMKNGLITFAASILEKVLPALNSFIEKLKTSSTLRSLAFATLNTFLPGSGLLQALAAKPDPGNHNAALQNLLPGLGSLLLGSNTPSPADIGFLQSNTGAKGDRQTSINASLLGGEAQTKQLESEAEAIAKLREELSALGQERELELQRLDMSSDEYSKLKIAIDERSKAEKASIGFSRENKEVYREVTEQIIAQKQALIDLQEEQKKSFSVGAREGLKSYAEDALNVAKNVENAFKSAFRGLEDALVNFVTTGKLSFHDLARSILADLARIAVQQSITGPLASALGGLFTGGASASLGSSSFGNFAQPLANGGVMTSAGMMPLQKYAAGGVARSPQLALFGEAGPEAFVPLPDGRRIPVALQGGGSGNTTVSVVVNVEGGSDRVESNQETGKQLGNLIAAAVKQELIQQKRPGGLLAT